MSLYIPLIPTVLGLSAFFSATWSYLTSTLFVFAGWSSLTTTNPEDSPTCAISSFVDTGAGFFTTGSGSALTVG